MHNLIDFATKVFSTQEHKQENEGMHFEITLTATNWNEGSPEMAQKGDTTLCHGHTHVKNHSMIHVHCGVRTRTKRSESSFQHIKNCLIWAMYHVCG